MAFITILIHEENKIKIDPWRKQTQNCLKARASDVQD